MEDAPQERVLRLQDLRLNRKYHMTAEDVDCIIHVAHPGPMPLCIVRGKFQGYTESDDAVPFVMQLIGWVRHPASVTSGDYDLTLMVGECCNDASLIATWFQQNPTGVVVELIAYDPLIIPVNGT